MRPTIGQYATVPADTSGIRRYHIAEYPAERVLRCGFPAQLLDLPLLRGIQRQAAINTKPARWTTAAFASRLADAHLILKQIATDLHTAEWQTPTFSMEDRFWRARFEVEELAWCKLHILVWMHHHSPHSSPNLTVRSVAPGDPRLSAFEHHWAQPDHKLPTTVVVHESHTAAVPHLVDQPLELLPPPTSKLKNTTPGEGRVLDSWYGYWPTEPHLHQVLLGHTTEPDQSKLERKHGGKADAWIKKPEWGDVNPKD